MHFAILNLLLGSISCDDDDPVPAKICYLDQIIETNPIDINRRAFVKFSYDDQDRIMLVEFRRLNAYCTTPSIVEIIWENDKVGKLITTSSYSSNCFRGTGESTISYENGLVSAIGDLGFRYNDDSTISEMYFLYTGNTFVTYQYNSEKNVLSRQSGMSVREYSYDTNPNFMSSAVTALGGQPAIIWTILSEEFFGQEALSVNNQLTVTDHFLEREWGFSYVLNEHGFPVEQFQIDPDGDRNPFITIQYRDCK